MPVIKLKILITIVLFLTLIMSCTKVVDEDVIPESAPYSFDLSILNYQKSELSIAITYDSINKIDQLDWHRFFNKTDESKEIFKAFTIFEDFGFRTDQISFKNSLYKDAINIYFLPQKIDLNHNGNLDELYFIEYRDSIVFQAHDHKINSNVPYYRFTTLREDEHYLLFIGFWHNTANNHHIVVFRKSNRLVWKNAKTADTLLFIDFDNNSAAKVPTGAPFIFQSETITKDSILILISHAPRNGHTGGGFDDYHSYLAAFRPNGEIIWVDTLGRRDYNQYASLYKTIGRDNNVFITINNVNSGIINYYLVDKIRGRFIQKVRLPSYVKDTPYFPVKKQNGNIIFFYDNDKILETDSNFKELSNHLLPFSIVYVGEASGGERRLELYTENYPKVDMNGDGVFDFLVTNKFKQIVLIDGKNFEILSATKSFRREFSYGIIRTRIGNLLLIAHDGSLLTYKLIGTSFLTRLYPHRELIFGILIVFLFIPFGAWSFYKIFYLNRLFRVLISRSESQGIAIFTKVWKLKRNIRDIELKSINDKACDILEIFSKDKKRDKSDIPDEILRMVNDAFISDDIIERDITFRDIGSKFLSIKIAPVRMFGGFEFRIMTLIDASNLVKAEVLSLAISIAHDAKNELSEVQTRLENLTYRVRESVGDNTSWLDKDESRISESITEIGETLRRLLFAADMPSPTLSKRNLNEIIDRWIAEKGGRYRRRNVTLRNEILPEISQINVDERHFGFLLQCACDNAVQAMDRNKKDGRILFSALSENATFVFSISDNGKGMSKEVLEQLNLQYFTTKSDGTGLGMKIIRKVAEEHNTHIEIQSEPGKGTDLKIYFKLI